MHAEGVDIHVDEILHGEQSELTPLIEAEADSDREMKEMMGYAMVNVVEIKDKVLAQ